MDKFLIIDGNSIMNRAFYGLMGSKMTNKEGIPTNAIYGFLNIYWKMLDTILPNYVAVSFDLKAPTFRHKMYAEYKGTRQKMPDDLAIQMPLIKEVLTAMQIPIIEKEGFEADDILGTVANRNEKENIFTYILTGDKDSFQLISEKTSIIIPTTKMGKTEYATFTPELLKEKFNILPYQVIHIKSLMGDSSDNIPGVKGIGEKTAYTLIHKYITLENIYENVFKLDSSPKIIEKLVENKDTAFLSKDLATIDISVPIELDYTKCKLTDIDKEKLYKIFKRLEFNKFMTKYDFSNINDDLENSHKESLVENNLNVSNVIYISDLNFSKYSNDIYLALNGDKISYLLTGARDSGFINAFNTKDLLILSIYDNIKDTAYIISLNNLFEKDKNETIELLTKFAMSKALKLGYNIKQDILYLLNNVCNEVLNFSYDIMIAYYLLDSNKESYPLLTILNKLFNSNFEEINTNEVIQISIFDEVKQENYNLLDEDNKKIANVLKAIYISYDLVNKNLKDEGMYDLFKNIEMPLAETLASMEHTGMYIDVDTLNKFDVEISKRLNTLEEEIYILADEKFNINSTQQLGHILFDKLGLPAKKKGKTGYSTDKSVLDNLQSIHPIIDLLIEYRQTMKLKSTYVDSLRSKIAIDGRIHTTFMQTVTATGRLSSVEPNLQNIPIKLELGRKIRSFFIAQNDNIYIDADYSQIELRVLAHISKDKKMTEAFNNNIDIHKVTASQVFDVNLEDVTSTMRSKAKAVNFGIVYGISEFGLSKNVNSSRKEAKEYIANYLEKYKGIRTFMENIVTDTKKLGYVTTIFGRRRYIPEINEKNKMIVQFGERAAMNTPIQGSAADIIKLAMNKIYNIIKERKLKSRLVMQVHDELIVETDKDEIEEIKKIIYENMEHIIKLDVPLSIDLNVGKSWYDAK